MTRCRVIRRWLERRHAKDALPLIYEILECGHVVEDPGKHAETRLCQKCNVYPRPAPVLGTGQEAVHYRPRGGKRRACPHAKSFGAVFSADPQKATCLSCVRALLREGRRELAYFTYPTSGFR